MAKGGCKPRFTLGLSLLADRVLVEALEELSRVVEVLKEVREEGVHLRVLLPHPNTSDGLAAATRSDGRVLLTVFFEP